MSFDKTNAVITDALDLAAKKTAAALRGYYPEHAGNDMLCGAELYSLMAGGKRIRPYLTLVFCRLFGGSEAAAMPFACAVEMMHTFSLIHDDLPCMDDDDMRRGRPTNHKVHGEATALLAGDALEVRSLVTALENPYAVPADALRAGQLLGRGAIGMIEGQIMDMAAETRAISLDELRLLYSRKTGELMRVSTGLGCIAAGVPDGDERMQAARTYALSTGMAFQIIDDVLDAESTADELGKSVGSDARDGKTTYLSFMSAAEAREEARRVTNEAINAVKHYPGSEMLVSLAEWLLVRRK